MNRSLHDILKGALVAVAVVLCLPLAAQKAKPTVKPAKQPATLYKNLSYPQLVNAFKQPPPSAEPWVFWYWMHGAVSREGITADLQAMKQAGIGGAYLMPIKDTSSAIDYKPQVRQLTPQFWAMVKFAMKEADRLGLKIGMHVSDGFALAGGPWITPELSMQKVVWTETFVDGGKPINVKLAQPETKENYYKDIAVYAYPTPVGADVTTYTTVPKVTTSKGTDAPFLVTAGNKQTFSSDDSCWIQYAFDQPFTARSLVVRTPGNNYQAHRLIIEASEDGSSFRRVTRLEPPRHGWQDTDADVTHSIEPTTAKFFRFVYSKAGSEPGAEDLDAAKWKPSLKLRGIELSGAAKINQYEGKNGSVWRVSKRTTEEQVPGVASVPLNKIINIKQFLAADGTLNWNVPAGKWTILRVGHTSTGHTNYTGGGGLGLECDKFNTDAITKQFDGWFNEAIRQAGPELATKVLKIFHIDSWECGSQNWSPVFAEEFRKRRGYDIEPYLPVMAGIPIESADVSERFLYDVRQTIAELVIDKFYTTMAKLAKAKGTSFTAESIAPTMLSDGMLHYKTVDIPMGEFWLNSPTHDKPNDMMDAISGAHVYGKPIIQAEAFTTVRMDWSEHPGNMKAAQDRNYALGINKLVYHVYAHNPYVNRKPGVTLDGVGLYFQRDQTWWKPGKAWVDYAKRAQALLQVGRPVADIAVFTGEELPRRSVLPDRLVSTLPGIIGEERVKQNEERLLNKDEPLREKPMGVRHSANMADPEDWIDPLRGYAYDSFNPDVLLQAKVENKRIVLPGGATYGILVLPQPHPLSPSNEYMSPAVAEKLNELVKQGASIIVNDVPVSSLGLEESQVNDRAVERITSELWDGQVRGYARSGSDTVAVTIHGAGRVVKGPYYASSFDVLGIQPDVITTDKGGAYAKDIAWTHRTAPGVDIYFFANQQDVERDIEVSLRVPARVPELWDAVTGKIEIAKGYRTTEDFRTVVPLRLAPNGSIFIVLAKGGALTVNKTGKNWIETEIVQTLAGDWNLKFDSKLGGPAAGVTVTDLFDWSKHSDTTIKYYSGTATYTKTFNWKKTSTQPTWLDLGKIANIAEVKLNGTPLGVLWTPPFRLDIAKALKAGANKVEIEVTNTWANRLIGDKRRNKEQRITNTTAPIRLEEKHLQPAGLLGPVTIIQTKN
ncbi:glycosyl hydrolase [Aridibaculum aurantiacum]|uniref:glycosyl hydrolase n=1 Tax=Aridibaculum aurantiacum TaxID=2810307 RepID=UPI001A96CA52|nr:glycosyl hydrolase [Aridibaculum aurantiacum]